MRRDAVRLLATADTVAFHDEQLGLYGGAPGLLSAGQLDAAVQAAAMVLRYEPDADLYDLAGAYAYHICQTHAFADGNKRAAYLATLVFLQLNGVEIRDEHDPPVCDLILAVARGEGDRVWAGARLRAIFDAGAPGQSDR